MQKRVIIFNFLIVGMTAFQMQAHLQQNDMNNVYDKTALRRMVQELVIETLENLAGNMLPVETNVEKSGYDAGQNQSFQVSSVQQKTSDNKTTETEYEKCIRLITMLLEQKSLRETNTFLLKKVSPQTREVLKKIINTPDKNYNWNNTFLHRASTALEVEQLLLLGADSEIKNELGLIPLMSLLFESKCQAAKALLSKSPPHDYNCTDNDGFSIVFYAIRSGDPEILDILLKNGASLNVEMQGQTPLMAAIESENPAMVRFLLKIGIPINKAIPEGTIIPSPYNPSGEEDISGTTPLMLAVVHDAQSVKLLLKAGADVNAVRADGATSLTLACCNQPGIIQDLIHAGAHVNVKNDVGLTPLLIASIAQPTAIIPLLKAGADVNVELNKEFILGQPGNPYCPYVNLQGMTPLLMAIKNAPETVPFMLECGADINHATMEGVTSLMMAIVSNSNLIPLLIQKGANVNSATVSAYAKMILAQRMNLDREDLVVGLTPLMLATLIGDVAMVTTLLNCGADVTAKNIKGLTALDMAKVHGLKNIEQILINH